MNTKRTLTLVACAAFAFLAMPAAHATTVTSNNITVKWNTQAVGSIALVGDYNATGQGGKTGNTTPVVYTAANGGSGTCTAAGGGVPADDDTVDYSAVTPDAVDTTDCLYKNAVNAKVVTSDSAGYTIAPTATVPASFLLCLLPNGTFANNMAITTSARAAAVAGITTAATCTGAPGNGYNLGSPATFFTSAALTAGTNLGGDLELVIAPNAPSGAQSLTLTYTLTLS